MDPNITKALNDKLYDKRKSGALELESLIRDSLQAGDFDRIQRIVSQLCHEYAYAVHQPHARNGGLIGLAAASIALGPDVARYLEEIVPPVLACFTDHDARVRYYACESMYNIAKVAKGEILVYFNQVFDALCKLAADNELSVKNGAELLDRLIKDIVAESAASYVSILHAPEDTAGESGDDQEKPHQELPTAFSLECFLPLLEERIHVLSPYTRTFLVAWITLLDSIPDLELVAHLPRFLGGLFKFLSDENQDVYTATQTALDRFLSEIKKIARIKRGIAESKKSQGDDFNRSTSSFRSGADVDSDTESSAIVGRRASTDDKYDGNSDSASIAIDDDKSGSGDGDWVPGQDVHVDHPKILEILVKFLEAPFGDKETENHEILLTTLRWIDAFFEICAEEMMPSVPSLLTHVLPRMSHDLESVRQAAIKVNASLMDYIMSLSDDSRRPDGSTSGQIQLPTSLSALGKELTGAERRDSNLSTRLLKTVIQDRADVRSLDSKGTRTPTPAEERGPSPRPIPELDYQAAVNALTLQFLNEHEATRVAAIAWLIMLHRMAPGKILSVEDGTFPALLKTLSDPSEAVVTRDLLLLSQISKNSDDSYFTSFMVNLLKLFCTDRRLLETRGNLIIRQLCVTLSAERIYRTMADCLEKDEDVEFASIMVQNLNNNLITAPELADLRKRLRNLDSRDGQSFFVSLFKTWCHNAVATFSLCLLAQAYEQAYHLLQIFADLEMTVNMLIQIDKLVQLLESPVFTYLRMQLLEPERYPYLYKCLYGLLMLLPQSSAFAALKNRLNSVSAIGYLHMAPRGYVPTSSNFNHLRQKSSDAGPPSAPPSTLGNTGSSFERQNRLKARDEGGVKWVELLDKFKATQERARKNARLASLGEDVGVGMSPVEKEKGPPEVPPKSTRVPGPTAPLGRPLPGPAGQQAPGHKPRGGLGGLGRFAGGVAGRKKK
ncbi:ARM repeat-containing protein [Bimuria novae-zelandiae CBS 107.79]|uniref:ARM repeat-containing protein n=1 Tax=Bimuria novae-zelandiae CBS 107.79 TaxID=1447943 RepID=A0A6A5V918_9PLEO|nr:ARM repeat-containing protein [Bimuria novae-zelandiae CBS 107.79]